MELGGMSGGVSGRSSGEASGKGKGKSCFYCGELWHWKRQCPKRRQRQQG